MTKLILCFQQLPRDPIYLIILDHPGLSSWSPQKDQAKKMSKSQADIYMSDEYRQYNKAKYWVEKVEE